MTSDHTTSTTSSTNPATPDSPRPESLTVLHSKGGVALYQQVGQLRGAGPAVKVQLPEGVVAWSVTRGDVVKKLLTHPHVSKNARESWPGYVPHAIGWLTAWVDMPSMFTSDGNDHRRLRDLVGKAFHPTRVNALRPAIEAIVTDLLDTLDNAAPGEEVDLRAEYAYRLPTRLICDLFGVPHEQRPQMLAVLDTVLDTSATPEQAATTQRGLYAVVTELIEAKRHQPGDDMTSVLLAAHLDNGDRLTEDELAATLILMIGAGTETTVTLLTQATRELLTHPDQLAAVLDNPERWGEVIEETLRARPPIMHLPLRYATEDIHLTDTDTDTENNDGGVVIPAGSPILIGFGAHGIDPTVHPNPEVFDIDRVDKAHLAFGHGIHHCLGAPLARLEARIALPALFARFPDMGLAAEVGELTPQPSFIANDNTTLPVQLRQRRHHWPSPRGARRLLAFFRRRERT